MVVMRANKVFLVQRWSAYHIMGVTDADLDSILGQHFKILFPCPVFKAERWPPTCGHSTLYSLRD